MLENELDIKKAQKGDHEAFTRLFRQLESQLYRLAKTILLKDEDCADALQETTLKVYKGLANLKQPKFFKTWVIRILINECNQLLRMRERTIAVAEIPEEPVVSYVHFEDSGNVDLQSFINQLDESLRLAIVLFYYDDLSMAENSRGSKSFRGSGQGTTSSRTEIVVQTDTSCAGGGSC